MWQSALMGIGIGLVVALPLVFGLLVWWGRRTADGGELQPRGRWLAVHGGRIGKKAVFWWWMGS